MALSAEYRTSIVTLRRQVVASPYDLKILKMALNNICTVNQGDERIAKEQLPVILST